MIKYTQYRRRGFTLIELLVVILIIGILTAVALPKYRASAEIAKATLLLQTLKQIVKAQEDYYLVNRAYTVNLEDLELEIPGATNIGTYSNKPMYQIANGSKILFDVQSSTSPYLAGGTDYVQIDVGLKKSNYTSGGYCYARSDAQVAEKVCRSLGVKTFSNTGCGMIIAGQGIPCKGGRFSI